MSDTVVVEKGYNSGSSDDGSHQAIYDRPVGIKGAYYHPLTQIVMLGLVCFMCAGKHDIQCLEASRPQRIKYYY